MTAATAQADADQPRPGRIGPREAAQLAAGARVAGVTRGSARVVLELLLRHTRGPIAVERRMQWIAGNVGISHRTTIRAIHDLVTAELVVVAIPGGGRTVAAYLVNVDLLRLLTTGEVTSMTLAVHPGESTDPTVTAGVTDWHPRGDNLSPQGCQNDTAGVTDWHPPTRVHTRAPGSLLPLYSKNPPPPEPKSEPGADDSPAASRGDPLPSQSNPDTKCPHGRTPAQGGCRDCGTTRRAESKRSKGQDEAQRRARDLTQRRAAEVEARAKSVRPPADWRRK